MGSLQIADTPSPRRHSRIPSGDGAVSRAPKTRYHGGMERASGPPRASARAFLIENGEITRALANVRYRMSALDLFSGIDLMGPQRLVRDWWSSNGMGSIVCLCPPIKVARATFTGSSPA